MMEQHLLLAALWIIFCFFHSYLANAKVKEGFQKKLGANYRFYRLFYTIFSFATLTPLLIFQFTLPSPLIFSKTIVTYILGGIITTAGVIIMGICIKKYFLSLSGIKTLITDHTVNDLQITGIHKYVRHPLYSGTFLFVIGLFILFPYLSLLIADVFVIGYTLLGIKWEEEKLITEFGDQYREYKKKVPKLIPFSKPSHSIN
ncbi:MAG TPA: isoprenylcysteine carboxylmethyltransferase family protein [Chitinophagaceae bacterium]|nr:isoprenylcysteine carboxylmethyltransferase family protein [Chitinophagaceae bacterium]